MDVILSGLLSGIAGQSDQNSQVVALLQEIVKDNKEMKELLKDVLDTDPYDKISDNSHMRKFTKSDFAGHFKVQPSALRCMVSGLQPLSNYLILSHLLPRSTTNKVKETLAIGISDVDSVRNFLILCKGFEQAYDSKNISFIPADNPFSNNRYMLKIWTNTVRKEKIYEGSNQTIEDFENCPLNLKVGDADHNPFKRIISYQAYRAFLKWHKCHGLTELPVDCDVSEYEGSYRSTRKAFLDQFALDCAADGIDDDADGVDGDGDVDEYHSEVDGVDDLNAIGELDGKE